MRIDKYVMEYEALTEKLEILINEWSNMNDVLAFEKNSMKYNLYLKQVDIEKTLEQLDRLEGFIDSYYMLRDIRVVQSVKPIWSNEKAKRNTDNSYTYLDLFIRHRNLYIEQWC